MNTFILIFIVPFLTGASLAIFGVSVFGEPLKFFSVILPVVLVCAVLNQISQP